MKTLIISIVLAFVLTLTQVNAEEETRDRRQTLQQCQVRLANSGAALGQVTTNCFSTTECSSGCMSALNEFKDDMGCCLTSISGSADVWSIAFNRCNISLPGQCGSTSSTSGVFTSSTSGVFASFSVVTFISAFSYIMN